MCVNNKPPSLVWHDLTTTSPARMRLQAPSTLNYIVGQPVIYVKTCPMTESRTNRHNDVHRSSCCSVFRLDCYFIILWGTPLSARWLLHSSSFPRYYLTLWKNRPLHIVLPKWPHKDAAVNGPRPSFNWLIRHSIKKTTAQFTPIESAGAKWHYRRKKLNPVDVIVVVIILFGLLATARHQKQIDRCVIDGPIIWSHKVTS